MKRIEKTVFISYRRANAPWALAIYQNLTANGYDAFFDYTGMASGDFEQIILGNIRARAHFLVLLTPSALERCGEPGDWLRREIEAAIGCRRNIVPLMLDGFSFASPSIAPYLTGDLELLKRYNGLEVPIRFFKYAMQELHEKYLNVPLSAVLHPVPPAVASASAEQQEAASAASPVQQEELTAQKWFERGYSATDPDEEVRCYTEAIRLKPDFGEAFCNRGNARQAKGDLDGAIRDYDEAVRLQPNDAANRSNRGTARQAKGDLDGAIRDYDEAVRLQPNDAVNRSNRGTARQAKGDLDGAIRDYTEAIRLKPDYGNAFYNLGIARRAKGDETGAQEDFEAAKRLGIKKLNSRGCPCDRRTSLADALIRWRPTP
jgi:tetratricopeptide (TPR) repeat protein